MLSHFTNITPTATDFHEPVYSNLFEITFTFPTILNLNNTTDLRIMMINALNITLDLTPDLNTSKQKFKYSDRVFIMQPEKTSFTFDINFNINVDNQFSIRTWNYMKKWYDLAHNTQTGELHYKKDMIGNLVAHIHDRNGVVIRRTEFKNVQIYGLSGMTFSWDSNSLISGTAKFVADYAIDQYYDIQQ